MSNYRVLSSIMLAVCSLIVSCTTPAKISRPSRGDSPNYNYTTDWFSDHIKNWSKYTREYQGKEKIKYLEVGVYEGRSAFWALDNILTARDARAVFLDPLFADYKGRFMSNLNNHPEKHKVVVKEGYSSDLLKTLSKNSFDIIYIDGDHAAKGAFYDLALSWDLLKDHGLLILDDYVWREDQLPPVWRPRLAIDSFLNSHGEDIEILHIGKQVFVKKKPVPAKKFFPKRRQEEYAHMGKCLFTWRPMRLYNSRGRRIRISRETSKAIKEILYNRPYNKMRNDSKIFAKFKELGVCYIK